MVIDIHDVTQYIISLHKESKQTNKQTMKDFFSNHYIIQQHILNITIFSIIIQSTLSFHPNLHIIITKHHHNQKKNNGIPNPFSLSSKTFIKNIKSTKTITKESFDDNNASSQFGTKSYWDDMYSGLGDFSSEEYSWYFGWDEIKKYFMEYAPQPLKKLNKNRRNNNDKIDIVSEPKILIPGVGNDGIVLDLYNYGYTDITAFDYSDSAIERQTDLLSYSSQALEDVTLLVRDARELDEEWEKKFDMIFEKGALDAIYLSGDGYVDLAVRELSRVIKKGGMFISVSGVVDEELRRDLFSEDQWEWLRDGSTDLKAGCFIWRRK